MDIHNEIMTAEEFFGGVDNGKKNPCRTFSKRGKNSEDKLLADLKVKMVMRIHGVSRANALEIIARREDEKNAKTCNEGKNARVTSHGDEGLLSAEEFFA